MPEIHKVVTTLWYNRENMRNLRQVFPKAQFTYVDFYDKERLAREVKDADVALVLGDVDPCLLGENTLKWIHCDHAGLNGSARPEVFARGIPVTGAAGRSAPVLAEHCVYFMLQHCYHTKELLAAQAAGRWGVEGSNQWRGLYGRTAGIVGLGHNGRRTAQLLKNFGMKVMGYDKYPVSDCPDCDTILCGEKGDTLDPLLEEADFVLLTLALTGETYHLFDKETFGKMKPGAFLVNMSRGGIVDTAALLEALEDRLGGAGLDVVEEEPLPPDHPLWTHPRVYITPHCTPQVPDRAARSIEIIRENARRFQAGEPLLNLLKPSDAIAGEEGKGGWFRLMKANLTQEQAKALNPEKYLGKRDWTDPSQWM